MTVRLECTTGGHNKFWTITIENEQETEVTYGAIGAMPRMSHKDHGSAEKAEQFKEKMIASKKKKGYVDAKAVDGAATAFVGARQEGFMVRFEVRGPSDANVKFEWEKEGAWTTYKQPATYSNGIWSSGLMAGRPDIRQKVTVNGIVHTTTESEALAVGRFTQAEVTDGAKADDGAATAKEPESKKAKVDSVSSTTHLEMTTGGHNKFWEIRVDGVKTTVSYGAIGAKPRESVKTHRSAADAQKFMVKMIGSKKREGYTDTSGDDGGSSGGSENTLYTFGSRVSAHELEKRHSDWHSWEVEDVCMKDVKHGIMSEAPAIAKANAEELNSSMPDLEDTALAIGEGDDGGEVIVISCSGTNSKDACVAGLKFTDDFLEEYGKEAELEKCDFHKLVKYGFHHAKAPGFQAPSEKDMEEMLEEDPERTAFFVAGTKIMAAKLKNHFVFGFDREVITAPLIYGGFASDGNIVGVLSSRVMT